MASFRNFKCDSFKYHKVGDLYQIDSQFRIMLEDGQYRYVFTIYPGFRTDGGSIPFLFRWFAKPWDPENLEYDACFILHDCCYASGYVHRDIADDMLRSSLRDIGLSRGKASTIHWCVKHFAKSHYEKDENADFVKFELFPIK